MNLESTFPLTRSWMSLHLSLSLSPSHISKKGDERERKRGRESNFVLIHTHIFTHTHTKRLKENLIVFSPFTFALTLQISRLSPVSHGWEVCGCGMLSSVLCLDSRLETLQFWVLCSCVVWTKLVKLNRSYRNTSQILKLMVWTWPFCFLFSLSLYPLYGHLMVWLWNTCLCFTMAFHTHIYPFVLYFPQLKASF